MTTVKQLREFLATLPDDTQVEVACHVSSYDGGYTTFDDLNLKAHTEFFDFRKSPTVKEDHPLFGKCFLHLGQDRD